MLGVEPQPFCGNITCNGIVFKCKFIHFYLLVSKSYRQEKALNYFMLLTNFCVRFLARNAFVRTNRRAIAMMFVRLSGMGVHFHHTVHVSADLSLCLDSPVL